MNKARKKQTIKFIEWTKRYSGWWYLICGHENEQMNLEIMQMLIKRLVEEEFYEIIFVLLEVHKNEEYIKSVQESLLKDLLISEWKKGNKDDIINKLILYLQ